MLTPENFEFQHFIPAQESGCYKEFPATLKSGKN